MRFWKRATGPLLLLSLPELMDDILGINVFQLRVIPLSQEKSRWLRISINKMNLTETRIWSRAPRGYA
jgi:hypothetical protein